MAAIPQINQIPKLSVIIPAYNEQRRISGFLESMRRYFSATHAIPSEVIVVDDGSQDGTGALVEQLSRSWPQLRCLCHVKNRGKGAAIRTGLLDSHGDLLLFADADGATPIEEERRLRASLEAGADLAIGSRSVLRESIPCRRPLLRRLAAQVFSLLARHYVQLPVRDTQCGFKMLRRETVMPLVGMCVTEDYLFDMELLARAHHAGLTIAEIGVSWRDVPGSKIRLIRDSYLMWRGLSGLRQILNQGDLKRVP